MLNKFSFCVLAFFVAFLFNFSACGDSSSSSDPEDTEKIEGQKEPSEKDGGSEEKDDIESSESSEAVSSSSEEEVFEPESSSSEFVYKDSSYYDAEKNTLTDFRDGNIYKTVTITAIREEKGDTTLVWMAENLNFYYNKNSAKSYCLEDDPEDCSKYGRRYTWSAAMDSMGRFSDATAGCGYDTLCTAKTPVRGTCPKGWHLPSKVNFSDLVEMAGGKNGAAKKLMATSGWKYDNGTDDYGFAALPGGFWENHGEANLGGTAAYFWSMTQYVPSTATTTSFEAGIMNITGSYVYIEGYDKRYAISVRCILD
jgi:uncharacterized protein (TIGR02145 family)